MYAAWTLGGDLITDAFTYDDLCDKLDRMGWDEAEVFIGRV